MSLTQKCLRNWQDIETGDDFTVRELQKLRDAGHLNDIPKYITRQELDALRTKLKPPAEFKEGGLVENDEDFSYPGFF